MNVSIHPKYIREKTVANQENAMVPTLRILWYATFCWLLLPVSGHAALSAPEAADLLLAWIASATPALSGQHCLAVTSNVFQNGGYTITTDAAGCRGIDPGKRRWRIDAFTSEVFEENDNGKFVLPSGTRENGPLAHVAFLAGRTALLPKEAKVVEYASLGPDAPDRAYVLWMLAPERVEHEKGEIYTCPDRSRGSYWSGPTRLSLLDTKKGVLLNTIPIADPMDETDRFDLPYRIPATDGFPYYVPESAGKDKEGRPVLLRLGDRNGDGKAHEFYLASAGNCMLMLYAVFGYDPVKDAAVHYPVLVTSVENGKSNQFTTNWLNFWPVRREAKKGRSQWEVDLRGRAGCLERYTVAYDGEKRRFDGRLTVSDCQE
jgi:hypothetical protein